MRKLFESSPLEGLKLVDPKYPNTHYLLSKNYVMVELRANTRDKYVSVYLRPYKTSKTLITAFVPELEYLSDLQIYNKLGLLKFLSRSKSISELYKATSTIGDKPFISIVHDFTNEVNGKVWCIQHIIDHELTPELINEDYSEYKLLKEGIHKIVDVSEEFLRVKKEHIVDFYHSYWKNEINPTLVKTVLEKCKKDSFWGAVIGIIDGFSDPVLREFIKANKIVLVCENKFYAIGDTIDAEDKMHDAAVIIKAEVLNKLYENTGYLFCVILEYAHGVWVPKMNMGELVEGISIMLDHVNVKAWTKIDESAYKMMPTASDIWYYSNPYHEGTILRKFMQDNDKTDYNVPEPITVVKEPDCIVSTCHVSCHDPWNDVRGFNYVISILGESLTIISEYQRYYPIWVKKSIIDISSNAMKTVGVIVNPWRYLIKKVIETTK